MARLIERSALASAVLIVGLGFQALAVSAHARRSASTNGAPLESVAYHRHRAGSVFYPLTGASEPRSAARVFA
jgi:hypothetical protein